MRKARVLRVGLAGILALIFLLRGQATGSAASAGTDSLSTTNICSLASFTDAQLAELLQVLATTPTIAAADLPRGGRGGNYLSLAHPDWPPLPGDFWQIPVWDLGSGFYLLNDVDCPGPAATTTTPNATQTSGWLNLDGGGGGTYGLESQTFSTNDLWLQITGTTNIGSSSTAGLMIHPPWNVTNGVYDLFVTDNLASGTWQWVLRCAPGQTNLVVTNLASPDEFFILGLTNDADGDWLSDAFEKLASHTNPNLSSTDGTGMWDGWEWQNFGSISNSPTADPDGDGLTTFQEFQLRAAGYNPTLWDTDGNGVGDGYEDGDGDGLANLMEAVFDCDLLGVDDLNSSGIPDWREDTDNDGLPDAWERMVPGLSWNSAEAAPVLPAYSKNPLP